MANTIYEWDGSIGEAVTPEEWARFVLEHLAQESVVFQSGAYGASASPQSFLGHPGCVEVLV